MHTRLKQAPRRRGGFTLLEMLIVLAIILVVAAMVVPNLLGRQKKANIETTRASIHGLEQTLRQYAADNYGEFPQGDDSVLFTLTEVQEKDGRTVDPFLEKIPTDAWGNPLHYEHPSSKVANGIKPAIWSNGPNQQDEDGGGDDVNNWSDETSI